jgi:membrane protease YdiL (CAAX protease family)
MAVIRPAASVADGTTNPERELWTFLAVAFAVSWGIGIGGSLVLGPSAYLIGVFGPLLAALFTARRSEGSTRSVWRPILHWRVATRWYVVAVALPLTLVAIAYGIVTALGGTWEVDDAYPVGGAIIFFVAALFVAGGPEEPGWRGYALPRLQLRYSALVASLVLGAIWALWHAPCRPSTRSPGRSCGVWSLSANWPTRTGSTGSSSASIRESSTMRRRSYSGSSTTSPRPWRSASPGSRSTLRRPCTRRTPGRS